VFIVSSSGGLKTILGTFQWRSQRLEILKNFVECNAVLKFLKISLVVYFQLFSVLFSTGSSGSPPDSHRDSASGPHSGLPSP